MPKPTPQKNLIQHTCKEHDYGYTLIELLITLSIMGFLILTFCFFQPSTTSPMHLKQFQKKLVCNLLSAKALAQAHKKKLIVRPDLTYHVAKQFNVIEPDSNRNLFTFKMNQEKKIRCFSSRNTLSLTFTIEPTLKQNPRQETSFFCRLKKHPDLGFNLRINNLGRIITESL